MVTYNCEQQMLYVVKCEGPAVFDREWLREIQPDWRGNTQTPAGCVTKGFKPNDELPTQTQSS